MERKEIPYARQVALAPPEKNHFPTRPESAYFDRVIRLFRPQAPGATRPRRLAFGLTGRRPFGVPPTAVLRNAVRLSHAGLPPNAWTGT